MSRLQKTNESFDSAVPYVWKEKGAKAYFTVGGGDYCWTVHNTLLTRNYELQFLISLKDGVWTPAAVNTGTRNAMTVFATILKITSEWMDRVKPEKITFNSYKPPVKGGPGEGDKENTSRSKLYTTMVKKYLPPEYEFAIIDTGALDKFVLKRKKGA